MGNETNIGSVERKEESRARESERERRTQEAPASGIVPCLGRVATGICCDRRRDGYLCASASSPLAIPYAGVHYVEIPLRLARPFRMPSFLPHLNFRVILDRCACRVTWNCHEMRTERSRLGRKRYRASLTFTVRTRVADRITQSSSERRVDNQTAGYREIHEKFGSTK